MIRSTVMLALATLATMPPPTLGQEIPRAEYAERRARVMEELGDGH